jgi:hypothetical protein
MTEAATLDRSTNAWKNATDGIQLIVFGAFLLLTTQGVLPWSFWFEAVTLWPVLLVGAGLRMIFERSRLPWVMLLSPVLIASALVWVARGGQPAQAQGPWVAREAARPADVSSWRLEAKGLLGRIDLDARPLDEGLLVRGTSSSRNGGERIEVRANEGKAVVSLRGPRETWPFSMRAARGDAWKLDIAPDLPLLLEVHGVGGTGEADLARGNLKQGVIAGVFNSLEVRLPAPTTETNFKVQGVFNSIRLLVPAGTPVRARSDGVLNSVDRPSGGDGPAYLVSAEGVMNTVEVVEAPALKP